MSAEPEPEGLSIGEAAEAVGRSRSAIARARREGRFPNAWQDEQGWWRIPPSDLTGAGYVLQPEAPETEPEPEAPEPDTAQEALREALRGMHEVAARLATARAALASAEAAVEVLRERLSDLRWGAEGREEA